MSCTKEPEEQKDTLQQVELQKQMQISKDAINIYTIEMIMIRKQGYEWKAN